VYLPARLKQEILRELERLELVLAQLSEIEAERDAAVEVSRASSGKVGLLTRLKGIGPEIATMLQLEAFFRSFGNRREVAAYAGLAPMPWKSGRLDREQGISKAGNPRLRTTMVELAWLWLRHQPGSALSSWFRERVGQTKGRVRRIAVVALARRLLVALWRYVETGVIPEGAEIKASVTGQ
jgi:transposase